MKTELRDILQKLHTDRLVLNYGSRVAPAKPVDLIRVISEWSQKDVLDLAIRNIIVDAILSSENKQIGSGIICACSIVHGQADKLLSGALRKHRTRRSDLSKVLRYFLGSGIVYDLCEALLEMGGMSSSIRFDLRKNNDFIVRQVSTHEILGVVHPIFGKHPPSIDSPVILAIDGTVESLGEIDHLLQRAAEIKCTVVLCALGFDPDVVNTLAHNWKLNRLNVLPFWLQKLDDNQSLLQLCEEMNITCITSERGDMIHSLKLDECSRVKSIFLSDQSLAIQGKSGDASHLEVCFPHRFKHMAGLLEDRCRIALRACVSISHSGRPDMTTMQNAILEMNIPTPPVSYAALNIGIRSAISCETIISDLGGIIIPE